MSVLRKQVLAVVASLTMLLTMAAASGCSDVQPCSNCPDIGGTYSMKWTRGSASCGLGGTQPASIDVGQVKSNVTAVVGASTLQGTLYDSYDFVLTGFNGTTHLMFRGYAVPGAKVDAGVVDGGLLTRTSITLNGTLTTSDAASDAGCDGKDAFIGTRISQ